MKTPEDVDEYLSGYGITLDLTIHKAHTTRAAVNAERVYLVAGREIRRQIRAQERLAKALK